MPMLVERLCLAIEELKLLVELFCGGAPIGLALVDQKLRNCQVVLEDRRKVISRHRVQLIFERRITGWALPLHVNDGIQRVAALEKGDIGAIR